MSPASSGPASDTAGIRALLHQDPYWAIYALGDLDPRRQPYCQWYTRGASVALLYREFDTPILWATGDPHVIEAVPEIDTCLLQIPEGFRPIVERRFRLDWIRPMLRMSLQPGDLASVDQSIPVEPLSEKHEHDVRELYADGQATHEDPDFFMRSQLADGTFFGVRRDGRLVAAGGTHLFSAVESAGAIGNVYTHRSHRGRGYGAAVTAAIARALIDRGTRTIALNVKADNEIAIRLYQRLGFRPHAAFYDGVASRR